MPIALIPPPEPKVDANARLGLRASHELRYICNDRAIVSSDAGDGQSPKPLLPEDSARKALRVHSPGKPILTQSC